MVVLMPAEVRVASGRVAAFGGSIPLIKWDSHRHWFSSEPGFTADDVNDAGSNPGGNLYAADLTYSGRPPQP